MTPGGYTSILAAILMGGASINAANAQTAAASQDPDGIYAVYIVTHRGDCDKSYRWTISVSGGRVSSAADTPMQASGHINHGVVNLAFERMGHIATVTGRLASGSGSGTWSSSTLQCAGSWRAARQG